MKRVNIPGLGILDEVEGLNPIKLCSDGYYSVGKDGVKDIWQTEDKKLELIVFQDRTLAYINSNMGYPAYYPLRKTQYNGILKAVLMDLDGTTVRSESFWIDIIRQTVCSLLDNKKFEFVNQDIPFVSGHSVSEHLTYCINTYCPDKTVEEARKYYFEHTNREMNLILEGSGRKGAFTPTEGIKEFLLELKSRNVKIALVTSGLYNKAYPEILSAFNTLGLGDPKAFYDSIITAGDSLGKGKAGTMGELEAKPHPWLYAEAARVGLGIPYEQRGSVIGIEDSGAGIGAVKLAGFTSIGISGGNIIESGMRVLCDDYVHSFEEILANI